MHLWSARKFVPLVNAAFLLRYSQSFFSQPLQPRRRQLHPRKTPRSSGASSCSKGNAATR